MNRLLGRAWSAVFVSTFLTAQARCELISVDSLGAMTMDAGTLSSAYTIGLKDLNPGTPVTMLGWNLGLRVVRLNGTGTVVLDKPSFVDAANNIFQGGSHAPGPLGVGDNSPEDGDFSVANTDAALSGVVVPGTTRGLVDLKFNASADASGDFSLRLVDLDDSSASSLVNTYWFDENYQQYYLAVNGAQFTSGIQLGTIHVNMAPVPEPSSLLLASGVAGLSAWRLRRKKTMGAGQPAESNEKAGK